MSVELRPCPFCGGEAEMADANRTGGARPAQEEPEVRCKACNWAVRGRSRIQTAADWNARADRTCRMKDGVGVTICCRCGALVSKKAVSTLTEFIPARFCPNCGARVVG